MAAGQVVRPVVLGRAGVPASGVAGVVLNVLTRAAFGGSVTVWKDGLSPAGAAQVHFGSVPTSDQVTVPVGTGGRVAISTSKAAAVRVDVVGYVDRSGKVVVPDKPLPLLSTKGSGVSQGSLGTLPVEADSVPLGLAGSASGPQGGSVSVNGVTLTLDAGRRSSSGGWVGTQQPLRWTAQAIPSVSWRLAVTAQAYSTP